MRRLRAELRYLHALLAVWSYTIRPFDMLADRRRWRWQPPQRCARWRD